MTRGHHYQIAAARVRGIDNRIVRMMALDHHRFARHAGCVRGFLHECQKARGLIARLLVHLLFHARRHHALGRHHHLVILHDVDAGDFGAAKFCQLNSALYGFFGMG